jgi:uncharacterized protein (TIGR02996 family)
MTDGDALLAAILANPDDDMPRLAYADWLEENGDEDRAEFIRLQCGHAGDDEAAEERAAELEDRNRGKWLADYPNLRSLYWEFRRGFVEILNSSAMYFLEWYDSFAQIPFVRRVCLYELDETSVRDLVSRTWNPSWVELELHAHLARFGVRIRGDWGIRCCREQPASPTAPHA